MQQYGLIHNWPKKISTTAKYEKKGRTRHKTLNMVFLTICNIQHDKKPNKGIEGIHASKYTKSATKIQISKQHHLYFVLNLDFQNPAKSSFSKIQNPKRGLSNDSRHMFCVNIFTTTEQACVLGHLSRCLWARDNRWLLSRVQWLAGPAGGQGPFVPVGGTNPEKRSLFCPGWWLHLG